VLQIFRTRDWLVLGPVGLAALGLAIWGFTVCPQCGCAGNECQQDATLAGVIQKSLDILVGRGNYTIARGHPWQLVVAAYLVPAVALFAAAKLFLGDLRKDVRVAFARNSRGHTIVCGLGDTGRHVVQNLQAIGERVVVVNALNDSAHAVSCENGGVPVIKGDATDAKTLELAGLRHAKALVLTTADDAVNLEIALHADEVAGKRRSGAQPLRVLSEMRSEWLYHTLTAHRNVVLGSSLVEFKAFNAHENAARLLFRHEAFTRRRPVMAVAPPHLVVVGFGRIGREVVAHAIRTAFALPSERLIITIVDRRGEAAAGDFFSTYPGIRDIAEIGFIAAALTTDAPDHWAPVEAAVKTRPPTAVIVCLPDDDQSLFTGLGLRSRLDDLDQIATSVFIRLRQSRKLGDFTSAMEQLGPLQGRLVPFGDLSYLTSIKVLFEDDLDELARAHHEQWLKSAPAGVRGPAEQPWDRLPETFKQANRQFADHVNVKLRAAGLHARWSSSPSPKPLVLTEAEVTSLAEMEHWRWSVERRMAGWRFGSERDNIRRRHPLLLDWSALDERTREQNRNQVRDLSDLLRRVGLELEREEIISAIGAAFEPASERVAAFRAPGNQERLIVVVEPLDPRSLELARAAQALPNVAVWLLLSRKAMLAFDSGVDWTGSDRMQDLAKLSAGWLTGEELERLEGGTPATGQPRSIAASRA
jgi:hypothetical protein